MNDLTREADRKTSLHSAKNHLARFLDELVYLISNTPTGQDRNVLCAANIHAQVADQLLKDME
jgi:hypothetical protein